jgi:radical SAM superfamily enzyme YgiQ (UPF0313 family)
MASERQYFAPRAADTEAVVFARQTQRRQGTRMKRFDDFVKELEKLSAKYGITVQSVGDVSIYGEGETAAVQYSRDETSGDLRILKINFTPGVDESPSMTL